MSIYSISQLATTDPGNTLNILTTQNTYSYIIKILGINIKGMWNFANLHALTNLTLVDPPQKHLFTPSTHTRQTTRKYRYFKHHDQTWSRHYDTVHWSHYDKDYHGTLKGHHVRARTEEYIKFNIIVKVGNVFGTISANLVVAIIWEPHDERTQNAMSKWNPLWNILLYFF